MRFYLPPTCLRYPAYGKSGHTTDDAGDQDLGHPSKLTFWHLKKEWLRQGLASGHASK